MSPNNASAGVLAIGVAEFASFNELLTTAIRSSPILQPRLFDRIVSRRPPMLTQIFRFDASRLHGARFHQAFAPRKPRRRLARLATGLLGLSLLALLVFFSVFVGVAMLTVGLAYRLLRQRKPVLTGGISHSARVVDGQCRIVGKTVLPSA